MYQPESNEQLSHQFWCAHPCRGGLCNCLPPVVVINQQAAARLAEIDAWVGVRDFDYGLIRDEVWFPDDRPDDN